MPDRKKRDDQTAKEYFLEQAAAYYDEMKNAAHNAEYGQFINVAEAVVLSKGRELLRQSLETITQEAIDDIEKKNETCPKCQRKKRNLGYTEKSRKPPPEK